MDTSRFDRDLSEKSSDRCTSSQVDCEVLGREDLPSSDQRKPAEAVGNYTCQVCFLEYPLKDENAYKLSCGHTFCKDCLVGFLTSKINDGQVYMKCFYLLDHNDSSNSEKNGGSAASENSSSASASAASNVGRSKGFAQCMEPITTEDVIAILNTPSPAMGVKVEGSVRGKPDVDVKITSSTAAGLAIPPAQRTLREKFERFKFMRDNKTARQCPACGHAQIGPTEIPVVNPRMDCERCGRVYCYFHSTAHDIRQQSCADYEESIQEELRASLELIQESSKPCPRCGMHVSKAGGCNHMKCQCGAAFCWLCGKEIEDSVFPAHFQWWNPAGCTNLQLNEENEPSLTARIAARIVGTLQLIVLGPLTLASTLISSLLCLTCIVYQLKMNSDERMAAAASATTTTAAAAAPSNSSDIDRGCGSVSIGKGGVAAAAGTSSSSSSSSSSSAARFSAYHYPGDTGSTAPRGGHSGSSNVGIDSVSGDPGLTAAKKSTRDMLYAGEKAGRGDGESTEKEDLLSNEDLMASPRWLYSAEGSAVGKNKIEYDIENCAGAACGGSSYSSNFYAISSNDNSRLPTQKSTGIGVETNLHVCDTSNDGENGKQPCRSKQNRDDCRAAGDCKRGNVIVNSVCGSCVKRGNAADSCTDDLEEKILKGDDISLGRSEDSCGGDNGEESKDEELGLKGSYADASMADACSLCGNLAVENGNADQSIVSNINLGNTTADAASVATFAATTANATTGKENFSAVQNSEEPVCFKTARSRRMSRRYSGTGSMTIGTSTRAPHIDAAAGGGGGTRNMHLDVESRAPVLLPDPLALRTQHSLAQTQPQPLQNQNQMQNQNLDHDSSFCQQQQQQEQQQQGAAAAEAAARARDAAALASIKEDVLSDLQRMMSACMSAWGMIWMFFLFILPIILVLSGLSLVALIVFILLSYPIYACRRIFRGDHPLPTGVNGYLQEIGWQHRFGIRRPNPLYPPYTADPQFISSSSSTSSRIEEICEGTTTTTTGCKMAAESEIKQTIGSGGREGVGTEEGDREKEGFTALDNHSSLIVDGITEQENDLEEGRSKLTAPPTTTAAEAKYEVCVAPRTAHDSKPAGAMLSTNALLSVLSTAAGTADIAVYEGQSTVNSVFCARTHDKDKSEQSCAQRDGDISCSVLLGSAVDARSNHTTFTTTTITTDSKSVKQAGIDIAVENNNKEDQYSTVKVAAPSAAAELDDVELGLERSHDSVAISIKGKMPFDRSNQAPSEEESASGKEAPAICPAYSLNGNRRS